MASQTTVLDPIAAAYTNREYVGIECLWLEAVTLLLLSIGMLNACLEAKKLKENVHYKSVLIAGDPRDEIIAYAEKEEASAIVVGNRGRGAIKRAFLGSVSTHIVHHSPIPVVVVHCKPAAESS